MANLWIEQRYSPNRVSNFPTYYEVMGMGIFSRYNSEFLVICKRMISRA